MNMTVSCLAREAATRKSASPLVNAVVFSMYANTTLCVSPMDSWTVLTSVHSATYSLNAGFSPLLRPCARFRPPEKTAFATSRSWLLNTMSLYASASERYANRILMGPCSSLSFLATLVGYASANTSWNLSMAAIAAWLAGVGRFLSLAVSYAAF